MLCLPPLKQGERIIWPLGGFQVRCFLGFSWRFQDLLIIGDWSGILTFLCVKLGASSLVTLWPFLPLGDLKSLAYQDTPEMGKWGPSEDCVVLCFVVLVKQLQASI